VVQVTVNGSDHARVGVDQPVKLAARLEMPPATGKIVQYNWTYGAATVPTVLPEPMQRVDVVRTVSFTAPGDYIIRLTANGQRDGLVDPADRTLAQNFKEVRVVVDAPPETRGSKGAGNRQEVDISGGAAPGSH
jgi:hypothetical protein